MKKHCNGSDRYVRLFTITSGGVGNGDCLTCGKHAAEAIAEWIGK